MPTPEEQLQAMVAKLETEHGRPLDWWLDLVDRSGLEKHGEKVALLKEAHGLGHGYANTIVHLANQRAEGNHPDPVGAVFAGKESLIPIHEALMAVVAKLGTDVEVSPKKASISLRRSKQFALIEPATKTRIDLGLNLKGAVPTERLKATGGMCTHKVGITDPIEVDDELSTWLREAYRRA